MNIIEVLTTKYKNCLIDNSVVLQDDGEGVYIREWNLPDPKPDNAQLNAWAVELEDDIFNNKQRELRAAAYGTWREQMDMQYHGTWHAHIEEVKQLYPLRDVD